MKTTSLGLKKPEGTDLVNIQDMNDNMDVIEKELQARVKTTGDIKDTTVTFTQASSRANIATGEKTSTIMGKIKKWFADMTVAAFAQVITSNTDLMALTKSGYLVDALAVKNQFAEVNGKLSNGTSGDRIGYYASQTFSKNDMTNTTAGNIKVVNRNGIVTIYIQNLQCTTNVPLLNINGYVGDSYYIYDKAGTGLYIDNSMLYSTRQNIDYLVFSFCL